MDALKVPMLIASTALSAGGSIQQGKAANKAKKHEAKQLERKGKSALARGTREAHEERRQGAILESDARAAMAASGGVTTDAAATEQLGKIKEVADYNSMAALYESETEDQGLRTKARARRFEGKTARKAGKTKALSTVLKDAPDIYEAWKGGKD